MILVLKGLTQMPRSETIEERFHLIQSQRVVYICVPPKSGKSELDTQLRSHIKGCKSKPVYFHEGVKRKCLVYRKKYFSSSLQGLCI